MARRERNGAEMGETTGGRKSAEIRRSPREHAGVRKKKGQPRVVGPYVLVVLRRPHAVMHRYNQNFIPIFGVDGRELALTARLFTCQVQQRAPSW